MTAFRLSPAFTAFNAAEFRYVIFSLHKLFALFTILVHFGKVSRNQPGIYNTVRMAAKIKDYSFKAKGSGKSGLLGISHPGQEVLERSACMVNTANGDLTIRMEIGFNPHARKLPVMRQLQNHFHGRRALKSHRLLHGQGGYPGFSGQDCTVCHKCHQLSLFQPVAVPLRRPIR